MPKTNNGTTAKRFIVHTVPANKLLSNRKTLHYVIDTKTNERMDDGYVSKRAANMDAAERNGEARKEGLAEVDNLLDDIINGSKGESAS